MRKISEPQAKILRESVESTKNKRKVEEDTRGFKVREDQKMAEKALQQTHEDRRKRTAVQKAPEWMKLEVIGSLPEHYFRCTCCGGIIEHSLPHQNKGPNGYEDLCSWCVNNAFPGWIVKED
jgi:hypothetical protein